MEIKIDSEEIDKYIRESLIKSSVGSVLQDAINKNLETINYSYNSAIQEYVRSYIKDLAKEILNNHKEEIYKKIAEKVTPNVIYHIVSEGVDRFMQNVKEARYD